MSKRVLIVGAGPGGLATAMLLAKAGWRRHHFEKQPRVGGTDFADRERRLSLRLGPTFFLYPQVLQEIFHSVGRDLFLEVPMTKLDPQYRLVFGAGGELNARPDIEQMVAEITKLSPQDAQGFGGSWLTTGSSWRVVAPCLQVPFPGGRSLISLRLLKVLPFLKQWKSLHAELAGYFKDPRLQLASRSNRSIWACRRSSCPSWFSILSFLEYEYGIWHPTGGCNAITGRAWRGWPRIGVKIQLSSAVEELLFTGRRATGVRTRRVNSAPKPWWVNADFAHAMSRSCGGEPPPPPLERCDLARKRFSWLYVHVVTRRGGTLRPARAYNIYVTKDYRRNSTRSSNGPCCRKIRRFTLRIRFARFQHGAARPIARCTCYCR